MPSLFFVCSRLQGGAAEKIEDTAYGNAQPSWPILQLVGNFLQALLEHVGAEQNPALLRVGREELGVSGSFQIALHKDGAHPSAPAFGPAFELLSIGSGYDARHLSEEDRVRDVMQGPNHGSNIAQRGALDPSLTDRTSWVSIEVHDDDIIAGELQLKKMKVAVNTDTVAVNSFVA